VATVTAGICIVPALTLTPGQVQPELTDDVTQTVALELLSSYAQHNGVIRSIDWDRHGQRVAVLGIRRGKAATDKRVLSTVSLLDFPSLNTLRTKELGEWAGDVRYSPDQSTLAVAQESGVLLWPSDLDGPEKLRLSVPNPGRVVGLEFDPQHNRLWGGDWNWDEPPIAWQLTGSTDARRSRLPKSSSWAFASAQSRIALGDADERGTIQLFDARWETRIRTLRHDLRGSFPAPGLVIMVRFSPRGSLLASVTDDPGDLRVWDIQTGRPLWTLLRPICTTLAFSPDGAWLAAGFKPHPRQGEDGRFPPQKSTEVRVFGSHDGRILGKLPYTAALVRMVRFSPCGEYLALVTGEVDRVERDNPEEIYSGTPPPSQLLVYKILRQNQ
jgi:WD40 repeat protein